MDKYEYKVRSDEIKDLIAQNEFAQAAGIADTIDWKRVKSASMLCTISDLYKVNRRYEDAKNVMLLAYERRPGGRTICYSLCELCIKTEDFVQAVKYYQEFVQAAPKDSGRYVLQYKLYEAQEVSLEERIGVLEELKKRDYREKWAYELAYLYHRVGLPARCVEECDELILWFGEGKYVVKAMELKMLHEPLTPQQQKKYERRFEQAVQEEGSFDDAQQEMYGQEDAYAPEEGRWDSYGQPEEGQWDPYAQGDAYAQEDAYGPGEGTYAPREGRWEAYARQEVQWEDAGQPEEEWAPAGGQEALEAEDGAAPEEELDIHVKTVDVGQYNTINLQEELAAGLQEVLGSDRAEGTEVFFSETGEVARGAREDGAAGAGEEIPARGKGTPGPDGEAFGGAEPDRDRAASAEGAMPGAAGGSSAAQRASAPVKDDTAELVLAQMRLESTGNAGQGKGAAGHAEPPREQAEERAQKSGGQPAPFLQEEAAVEKQITGQLRIEDILAEWEQTVKSNEEKCKEEVRQHVLRQTGPMFTEFEAAVRDGLLERLEKGEAGAGTEEAGISSGEHGTQQTAARPAPPEAARLGVESARPAALAEENAPQPGQADTARAAAVSAQPPGAAQPVEKNVPPAPAGSVQSAEKTVPSAPAGEAQPAEKNAPPAPAGSVQSAEKAAPSAPAGTAQPVEKTVPPAPAGAVQSAEKAAPPAPAGAAPSKEKSAEPPAPAGAAPSKEKSAEPPAPAGVAPSMEKNALSAPVPVAPSPGGSADGEQSVPAGTAQPPAETAGKPAAQAETAAESPAPAPEHTAGAGHAEGAIPPRTVKKPELRRDPVRLQTPERLKQNKEIVQQQTAEMLKQITGAVQTQTPGKIVSLSDAVKARTSDKQKQASGAARQSPEPPKQPAEASKQSPEAPRQSAEPAKEVPRQSSEPAKKSPEPPKQSAESAKKFPEPPKQSAESAKKSPEPPKQSAEPAKQSPESQKQSAEPAKQSPEPPKQSAEPAKEPPKQSAEPARQSPEQPADRAQPESPAQPAAPEPPRTDKTPVSARPTPQPVQPQAPVGPENPETTGSQADPPVERDAPRIRSLTREERELYAPFIQSRSAKEQLVQAIDNVSMAAYTGNVVVTGEEGMDTLTFAKNMTRELKMIDSNFSGRVAKISGQGLNQKDVGETLWHLNNGALIIYHASGMNAKTAASLYKSLQQEHLGIVIIMEDTKKAIQRLFLGTPELFGCFTARMDLQALSNDKLVSFGRKYAREMEYSIDEMGVLALHTRIEELQTIDHVVTVVEVKKIVDGAIRHARRKTLGHFFDILFAKRYDDEDMIILTEKDFA